MKRLMTEFFDWAPLLIVLAVIFGGDNMNQEVLAVPKKHAALADDSYLCLEDMVLYPSVPEKQASSIQLWKEC